jgi:hypothetical protein
MTRCNIVSLKTQSLGGQHFTKPGTRWRRLRREARRLVERERGRIWNAASFARRHSAGDKAPRPNRRLNRS